MSTRTKNKNKEEFVIELIDRKLKTELKDNTRYPDFIILTLSTYIMLKDELGISLEELPRYKAFEVTISNTEEEESVRFSYLKQE